ncbi:MAG: glycosyltransferase [Aliishimia sp.]
MTSPVTIIIPAHNEADYIVDCLTALLAQDHDAGVMRVIVAANACTDMTVALCQTHVDAFEARDSILTVLDIPEPGKVNALNVAETRLEPGARLYLDADVCCDRDVVGQLRRALSQQTPCYATGTLAVAPTRNLITRAYAKLWQELPFIKSGAVGAGLFALNAAGRSRWGAFPDIISDDTFVRLNFAPSERIEVPARYHWPMIDGFSNLVKVRRRQNAGVDEVRANYPQLMANDDAPSLGLKGMVALALRMPIAFAVYLSVHIAVRTRRPRKEWVRGR